MLDYKVIMGRVMRAAKCSRDDAWSAIAEVYASGRVDTKRSRASQLVRKIGDVRRYVKQALPV